jgi:hypothetical protein
MICLLLKTWKKWEETEFIQSVDFCFPDEYPDFIKVERILHGTIVDNKTNEKFASVIRQSVRTNTEWNNKLNK